MLKVEPINAYEDNYIWLVTTNEGSIVIDPGDANPVIEYLNKNKDLIGEIDSQVMHYTKLEKYFGWNPRPDFNYGLAHTIKWYKTYLQNINL